MKPKKGLIHVYTGGGKGKTTAAMGLVLRALGAGFKVYIGQFLKRGRSSELDALKKFGSAVTVEQFGTGCFVSKKPAGCEIMCVEKGLNRVRSVIAGGGYDMVVLDELNTVLGYKMANVNDVIKIVKSKPCHAEIVMTGRMAPKKLMSSADLVTEMKEIRHYYKKGVGARAGIER
ncbi:MAG: cob(I)yrinic acid a,c-diamide adenosyltransferase [Candidatus Omnitrophica bacterium]|nr:cob(I)yrinic acid a,c-diamide adenosyltransferase [Candidatus Omnitrophota bacterium]